jgi:hypothetical protein
MDVILDLLREILERLIRIESFGTYTASFVPTLHSRAASRHESLESYRAAYNRQNGFTDSTIHPTNPAAEDEID